ncbi:hypothetical protein CKAH01_19087 [Colletotrichum kahawae]|uniref:Uncharacterized protein n=1 Tax=Colletotrichum kahawae TaxID=34407 RepID=A0AAE0CZ14_COLKA|nr:hypothetical protein CKAH01_19087 [Colletotrichum kahawae]
MLNSLRTTTTDGFSKPRTSLSSLKAYLNRRIRAPHPI